MRQAFKRLACACAAALGLAGLGTEASAQSLPSSGHFGWTINSTPYPFGFTPSPFLSDDPAQIAQTRAALIDARNAGKPLAIKVLGPLTSAGARQVFNDFAISYVFLDVESFDRNVDSDIARSISNLALASTRSKNAFIGNFNFYPNASNDTTRPGAVEVDPNSASFLDRPENFHYSGMRGQRNSNPSATRRGKLMINESLYPGSPDYRNPAQGNSNAPNIRSALFVLPIQRAGLAQQGLPSGDRHIPWVSRFNNFGNSALDSDGDPTASGLGTGNLYEFDQTGLADPTTGQLPGRGDFRAQVLHYRLRGAQAINHFTIGDNSSVIGYSDAQAEEDIRTGFGNSNIANQIFQRGGFSFANLTNFIGVGSFTAGDGPGSNAPPGNRTIEQSGAVWSGVRGRDSAGRSRLVILMSNLDETQVMVDLPNAFSGLGGMMTVARGRQNQAGQFIDDYFLEPGQHRQLTFTQSGRRWLLDTDEIVFTGGVLDDRSGIGVPEPTGLGLIGLAAVGLLARKRRRA